MDSNTTTTTVVAMRTRTNWTLCASPSLLGAMGVMGRVGFGFGDERIVVSDTKPSDHGYAAHSGTDWSPPV